jgi:hypothetical protein
VDLRRSGYLVAAVVVVLVAWVAVLVAQFAYGAACEGENTTAERCTANLPQLIMAGCGLLPATMALISAARARLEQTRRWIAYTVVAYAIWTVLLVIP